MIKDLLKTLLFGIVVFWMSGCRHSSSSRLSHTEGALSRITSIPLEKCSPPEEHNVAITYLEKIFRHVAAANSQVFRDDLDPSLFCIYLEFSDSFNAAAFARTRRLEFMSGVIDKLDNDAQVAAVISHELAHISMRHFLDATIAKRDRAAVVRRWVRINKLADILASTDSDAKKEEISSEVGTILYQINTIIAGEYSPEIAATWMEQEADEVGYEFFLRAGFDPDQYGKMIGKVGACDKSAPTYAEPLRGTLQHPSGCWRVWNLGRENQTHRNYYREIKSGAKIINLDSEPSLKQAQQYLNLRK